MISKRVTSGFLPVLSWGTRFVAELGLVNRFLFRMPMVQEARSYVSRLGKSGIVQCLLARSIAFSMTGQIGGVSQFSQFHTFQRIVETCPQIGLKVALFSRHQKAPSPTWGQNAPQPVVMLRAISDGLLSLLSLLILTNDSHAQSIDECLLSDSENYNAIQLLVAFFHH